MDNKFSGQQIQNNTPIDKIKTSSNGIIRPTPIWKNKKDLIISILVFITSLGTINQILNSLRWSN